MNYDDFTRECGRLMRLIKSRDWEPEEDHYALDLLAEDVVIELANYGPDAGNKANQLAPVILAFNDANLSRWYA